MALTQLLGLHSDLWHRRYSICCSRTIILEVALGDITSGHFLEGMNLGATFSFTLLDVIKDH
jgi:hypothetical protein